MRSAPDSTPTCARDSFGAPGIALDSGGILAIGIGAATDFFCAAKAAEGASPRTVEWYRMILIRAVRRFGDPRPVDAITAAGLRTWLLRETVSDEPAHESGLPKKQDHLVIGHPTEEALTGRSELRPLELHRVVVMHDFPRMPTAQRLLAAGSRWGCPWAALRDPGSECRKGRCGWRRPPWPCRDPPASWA